MYKIQKMLINNTDYVGESYKKALAADVMSCHLYCVGKRYSTYTYKYFNI